MARGDDLVKPRVPHVDSVGAINSQYVAFTGNDGIHIQCLQQECPPIRLPYGKASLQSCSVLALSPIRHNLLATADVSRVLVFNIAKRKTRCILKGNGRMVTAISFSEREYEIIVTGAVDGSICVWSIKQASRPLHQLNGLPSACSHIAIQSVRTGVISSVHHRDVVLWSITDSKLLAIDRITDSKLIYLYWRSKESVISVSDEGCIKDVRMSPMRNNPKAWKTRENDRSSDDEYDAALRAHEPGRSAVTCLRLDTTVKHAKALGAYGIVVLPPRSDILYFYSYSLDDSTCAELWRLHVDSLIECFALRYLASGIEVVVYTNSSAVQSFAVPPTVLDAMHWFGNKAWASPQNKVVSRNRPAGGKMLPAKIQRRRALLKSNSKKIVLAPLAVEETTRKKPPGIAMLGAVQTGNNSSRSLNGSLELPRERDLSKEHESPMPFLSPTIPARKISPGLILPFDEDLSLLPRSSFDSMTSTATHEHDSDSDDETFAGNLRNSGTLLPGGVNVPIARTCGAAFAPSGHLVTFFPAQQRPASAMSEKPPKMENESRISQSVEATYLFARFGNFGPEIALDQVGSVDDVSPQKLSPFSIQAPFLEHHPSWPAKISPVKTTLKALHSTDRVTVSVRNIEALTPARKLLATKYSICPEVSQSVAELSLANAEVAAAAEMYEASEAWHLLAIILEQRSYGNVGLENSSTNPSVGGKGQSGSHPCKHPAVFMLGEGEIRDATILLSYHPFGAAWAVEQLFASLERQADVQLLAYMSALLVTAFATSESTPDRTHTRTSSSQSIPTQKQMAEMHTSVLNRVMLPILRTDSVALTMSEEPPMKRKSSQSSSRNASQPSTPYLDSLAGTPPFAFLPAISQGTRTSFSGSASPEHHRSGFSNAAKNYAASIAEKFAVYGSSPPTKRRGGVSPANELSTSLPSAPASSSWSKSVSFASTLGAGGSIDRSPSLLPEDGNYDSDRTIEHTIPTGPKSSDKKVLFKLKNENRFYRASTDEITKVLPESILIKSTLWRRYHADQLRSWDLLQTAAELESIPQAKRQTAQLRSPTRSMVCQDTNAVDHATCSICHCVIYFAKQLCPACLHISHPRCLDQFVRGLSGEPFTCPSGCGCSCNEVTGIPNNAT